MWIFYLIDVLDSIKITAIIAMGVIVLSFLVWFYETDCEDITPKRVKKFVIAFFASLVVSVFCPSAKTSYMALGVGSVVDYVRSNDTAKQLPDKAIIALDKWLDNYTSKKEQQ